MEHEASGVPALDVTLRLVLLLSSSLVSGTGLTRPAVRTLPRTTLWISWAAASVAALAAVLTAPLTEVALPLALAHAVLAVAVPAVLNLPRVAQSFGVVLGLLLCVEVSVAPFTVPMLVDLVFTGCCVGWLGMTALATAPSTEDRRTVRAGPLAVAAAAGLAATSVLRLLTSGVAFDRRLWETGYGVTLVVVVVCAAALVVSTVPLVRRAQVWRAYRVGGLVVVVALLGWATLPAIPRPPEPPSPGVPLLAHGEVAGHSLPLLVSPHRPGTNLVHFPDSAGEPLTVRTERGTAHARTRPGTSGTWAEVELPPGRSELVIGHDGAADSVEVDAGTAQGPASATGSHGPECASAALGSLVAGQRGVLSECPSDELAQPDADALRKLVGFIIANGARSVNLVTDDSVRSRRAAEVLRTAPSVRDADAEVRVNSTLERGDALLVVSGWATAGRSLDTLRERARDGVAYSHGVYLAPWLSYEPILNSVANSFVPLRFDPRENRSLDYGMRLSSSFGGEPPSVAGFQRWLQAQGEPEGTHGPRPVSVYASAQVDVMKMPMPDMPDMGMHGSPPVGQWNPRGTIVAISGALP